MVKHNYMEKNAFLKELKQDRCVQKRNERLFARYRNRHVFESLDDENLKRLINNRSLEMLEICARESKVTKYENAFETLDNDNLKRLVKYGRLTAHQRIAISNVFMKRGLDYDSYKKTTENVPKIISIDKYVKNYQLCRCVLSIKRMSDF